VLDCRDITVSPAGTAVLRSLSLQIGRGERTVLVGPSGAGKTTLIRAVAGLQPLSAGTIELNRRRLDSLPAHRRRVAVVFQEPRLLPHLRVDDNVALALRAAGVGRRERRRRATERLDEVGLSALATRAVRGLSGGEQQRVALARALCAEPDLLMLDEPLAALDPNRRESLRRLIVSLTDERALTTLVITHDRAEAAELGERIALMLEGRIIQHAPPRELFERPGSAAVARFFGISNLLRGDVRSGRLALDDVSIPVHGPDGVATFAIRPEAVTLSVAAPYRALVVDAVYAGSHVRVTLRRGARRLEAHVAPEDAPAAGEEVGVGFPPQRLWRLPAEDPGAEVLARS
jgi:thiamine transport system ATP-binding protein